MISLVNDENYINSSSTVLNLSDKQIELNTYDISEKIQEYKIKYKAEYLRSFDNINVPDDEQLTYSFSSFSWKSYFLNNVFLDIIYYLILVDFLNKNNKLIVFTDRADLFEFIKLKHYDSLSIQCKSFWWLGIKQFLRPCFYLSKMILSKIRYGKYSSDTSDSDILIYSYAQNSSFMEDGSWNDTFLGDLLSEIKDNGYSVTRFVPIDPMLKFEQKLKETGAEAISLISFFSMADVFKILLKTFTLKNTIKGLHNIYVGNSNITILYKNHLRSFLASNNSYSRYAFYYLFKKTIEQTKPKIVIYPYENQPWEKSINKVCSEYNVSTIAINHSMICSDMLHLYASYDLPVVFKPNYLIANGQVEFDLLQTMDRKQYSQLELIGSKRHKYDVMKVNNRDLNNIYNVAVILNGEKNELLDIVKMLNNYNKDIKDFTFYLKPPPGESWCFLKQSFKKIENSVKFNVSFCEKNIGIDALFKICDTVIFAGSTVGIEAYISNKICLRYTPNQTYDLDMTETLSDGIYTIGDSNFSDIKHIVRSNQQNKFIDTENYFKSWDKKKFNKILKHIVDD